MWRWRHEPDAGADCVGAVSRRGWGLLERGGACMASGRAYHDDAILSIGINPNWSRARGDTRRDVNVCRVHPEALKVFEV